MNNWTFVNWYKNVKKISYSFDVIEHLSKYSQTSARIVSRKWHNNLLITVLFESKAQPNQVEKLIQFSIFCGLQNYPKDLDFNAYYTMYL